MKTNYSNLTVGTRIYYTGDMANVEGVGTIVAVTDCGYNVKLDDGRDCRGIFAALFGPPGHGCANRFQLLSERQAWRDAQLEALRASLRK